MTNTLFCCKLKKEAQALPKAPFPGPLGLRILNEVSKEAWASWLSHQTMLINEYRLNLMDAKSKQFLQEEMEKYFFGTGSDKPAGFSPKE